MSLRLFFSLSFLVVQKLVRCKAGEYDPSGRIYPWPLPTDRQPLFFGLIVSFGETFNSSGVVPGVNVALDIINSNESQLLDGYSLHYVLSDSQCSRPTALDVFFDQILSKTENRKLAIIGAGCSPATEPTAEISHQFNITQLSCASTSPTLSDRKRFKKYFQLLPSMVDLANVYVGIFRRYGWRHVTMIVQEENLFTEMIRRLKVLLTSEKIAYTEYTFSSSIGLSDLKVEPFTAFYLGIRYPTHLMLTFQWYEEQWWLKENDGSEVNLTCSGEERESVLQYSLAVNFVISDLLTEHNITTDIGISGQEYEMKERDQLGVSPHNFTWSPYAQYCFDATLTLAYALNQTISDAAMSDTNSYLASAYGLSHGFRLEDFNYGSDALTNIIFAHLQNTSFNGVTGEVSFNEQGIRTTERLSIYQLTDREDGPDGINWVKAGTLVMHNDSDDYIFSDSVLNIFWPSGVPFDGIPARRTETVSLALAVVIYLFAVAGIIFAIVCLTFNCVFRNRKLIRLSSPNLNTITVLGVIVLYLSAVLFAIPSHYEAVSAGLCIARLWFLSLGVSLAFGTIIMKMFRVYIIFRNPTPKRKKFVKDWMLALGIVIMVVIDLVVLINFTAIVLGLNLSIVQLVPDRESPLTVEGAVEYVTEHYIYVCQSTPEKITLGILSVYKGVLQLVAFFLAICIPRVKVKGLNDAKYIIAAVYVSSLGLILATLTHFTVTEYIDTHTALYSVATCLSGTAILGLLFIPKMVGLYKDPKGESVFSDFHTNDGGIAGSVQLNRATAAFGTEETLRKKIIELESVLCTYKSTDSSASQSRSDDSTVRLSVPMASKNAGSYQGTTLVTV